MSTKILWPKALLFDLDGTLIDSAPDIAAAANRLLVNHGLSALSLREIRSMIGNGVMKLVERAFAAKQVVLDKEELEARNQEMMLLYAAHLTVLTGEMTAATQLLQQAHAAGVAISVVTNKPERFTHEIIAHFEWSKLVSVVVGGDSCKTRKPAPDMLLHALDRLGVGVNDAVMIGDSPADIEAAQNAKMRSIVVRGGYTNIDVEDLGADLVCDSLADVPAALGQLPASA